MASYRFSASVVSRGKGQSAVAKVAYIAREDILDERTGEMKRYSDRPGLKLKGIAAPENAPEWAHDLAKLVNALEAREDKSNHRATAQLGRDIELNLPHELSLEECRRLLRDFNREEFTRHGMIVIWAIHAADTDQPEEDRSHGGGDADDRDGEPQERKNPNPHAHLFIPFRPIGPDGFGNKVREWNSTEMLNRWREKWAELGARYLAKKPGLEIEAERYKVAHHTLVKQRETALERGDLAYAETLDRAPQKHLGPTVIAMMRRGAETDIGNAYRDDLKYAKEEAADRADLSQLDRQIAERRREIGQDAEPDPEDPDPAQAPPAIEPAHEDPRRIEPKPPPDHAQRHQNYEQQRQAQEIAQAHARARKALTAALSAETEHLRPEATPPPESTLAQIKKYVVEHYLPELAKFRHNAPDFFLQIFTALHEVNDKVTERLRNLEIFSHNRETALATPTPAPKPKKKLEWFTPTDPDHKPKHRF